MVLDYWKIVRWVALAAVVLGLLAAPVIYIKHATSQAYTQGYAAAETKLIAEAEHERSLQLAANQATEAAEHRLAIQRQNEATKFNAKVKGLELKLSEALEKNPAPVGCLFNDNLTGMLRSAADGTFSGESPVITGRPPETMSEDAPVPKQD